MRRRSSPSRSTALLAAGSVIAGVVASVLAAVATAPAAAAWPSPNVTFNGHGWGHGRGMGQYGAYGYAKQGWSYLQILDHFYGGTAEGTETVQRVISVRLMAMEGSDLIVTSSTGVRIGAPDAPVVTGAVRLTAVAGAYVATVRPGCDGADGDPTPVADPILYPANPYPGTDTAQMLTLCASGAAYRGQLRLVSDSGLHTVNTVLMEEYLRGVVPRESPASWADAKNGGAAALQAQAVAARSYAWAEDRKPWAKTCDTTSCQVYGGAIGEDPRSNTAIDSTHDEVRRDTGDGSIARTEFSSSTGGYTAGGTFPSVPDDGDVVSPYHSWTVDVPAQTVADAYGVGQLVDISVLSRNGLGADGGRVLSVRITGTTKTVTTTGNDVQAKLGLRSNWFTPVGVMAWFRRDTATPGAADAAFSFGAPSPTAVPMYCDWFGQGFATPGVWDNGTWVTSKSPTGATIDQVFRFGDPTDVPLCGDWDGNGTQTPAVWRQGTFYLSNTPGGGPATAVRFGNPTDRPITGKWKGAGFDLIGVDRDGQFFLSFDNVNPTASLQFRYGDPGDTPVAGDWDGDGTSTVGIRRGNTFYLSDNPLSGVANRTVAFGDPGDLPVVGRFGTAKTWGVAVARRT